ncbi:Crp/Fnr family transcriptional regulator [Cytophagaceae bacterium ABcell3]|nr:Crp/Fnr family transcriptional regulator [Cytophagaceae bacterium ABcell3]
MKAPLQTCENCQHRKDSVFKGCDIEKVADMDQHKSCFMYKKGQIIFHEDGFPSGLYCIHSGKVKIAKSNSEGKEQILRLAKQGDIIGYRSLVAGTPYSASGVVLEDALVCFFSKEYFENNLLYTSPVSMEISKLMSVELGKAEERMTHMALKPVRERLAEALLLLHRTFSQDNTECTSINILREDLANIVGTTKETAIRFLSEFKNDKIISSRGSNIVILDLERLIQISKMYD